MPARGVTRLVAGAVSGLVLVGAALGALAAPALATTHRAQVSEVSVPGGFVSVAPARILDTRIGLGATRAKVAAHSSLTLTVAGAGGVPASGAAAAVLNVTVTNETATGYITLYPSGSARPTTSNLNLTPPASVANLVTVQLGTGGAVTLYNGSTASADLIADVAGYYLAGTAAVPGAFHPLSPARILDTRIGQGAPEAKVAGHGTLSLKVTGAGGIPTTGASAVVMNLTVTRPTTSGFVTAYPAGITRPTASNVNFAAGASVPNQVTIGIGSGGKVSLYNGATGSTDLIADVAGYYLSGTPTLAGTFVPVAPSRFLDSRIPQGTELTSVAGRTPTSVQVLATGAVPTADVGAVVVNLTVTAASTSGYLIAYPMGTTRPVVSNLNFVTGVTRANAAVVAPGNCGQLTIYDGAAGTSQLVGDVSGYFLAGDAPPPVTPTGTVHGWGTEGQGLLGNGLYSYPGTITAVTARGVSGVSALSAQGGSVLALGTDQTVQAWGPNLAGQLGVAPFDPTDQGHQGCGLAVGVPGLSGVTAVAGGDLAGYALRSDGTVWAWGSNNDGQLGDGTLTAHATPAQVPGLSGVVAVDAGAIDALAVRSDGTVWGWGGEVAGELGGGDDIRSTPTRIAGLSNVVAVAAGSSVSYALTSSGTVWAWGTNAFGARGDGSTPDGLPHPVPVQVTGLAGVTAIDAGPGSIGGLALLSDGTVRSWGLNGHGELGDGTSPTAQPFTATAVTVSGLSGVTAISADASNGLALTSSGAVWAWGATPGDGVAQDVSAPVQVPGISGATAITQGPNAALVVLP